MSEVTVDAIVLRRRDSGESDRRLTILTRELGKIDVVAKGARKSASRLSGSSDPLSVSRMTFATGRKTRFVTQAQPKSAFRGLRTDYDRLTMALAMTELFAAVLPWEEPAPEVFDLLWQALETLELHVKPVVALVWAEVRLLDFSGFAPQFDSCVTTGQPVAEAAPYLSPGAGGYVSDPIAGSYSDRFSVRAEVLYGLHQIRLLEQPPSNLKFAVEALAALLPFWRHIADLALPANESMILHLKEGER